MRNIDELLFPNVISKAISLKNIVWTLQAKPACTPISNFFKS